MPKATKAELQKNASLRQKMLSQVSSFLNEFQTEPSDMSDEERDDLARTTRREDVPPPPAPEKTKANPDRVVDIVTFAQHPHFLNLKLTPWQKIILKAMYMGTEGNSHESFTDLTTEDCSGCVWNTSKKSEEAHWRSVQKWKTGATGGIIEPLMLVENSPCLTCTRFDDQKRADRFEYRIAEVLFTDVEIDEAKELAVRELADKFQTEIDLIQTDMDEKVWRQVLDKKGRRFQELVLVLGRRSGKSFMVSVICLYEAYTLLMMGHPQDRFRLTPTDTITLLNVAGSETQAKEAIFSKIAELTKSSPFFQPYMGKPPTETGLHLCTPYDMAENERRIKNGGKAMDGSIHILSGHSGASTLVGLTCYTIIVDEMAPMEAKAVEGGGTASEIYSHFKPMTATFGRNGKFICISNPLGPSGKFYELWKASFKDKTMLMFQLPTWASNPNIERSFLESERAKDPGGYEMFYGAKFGAGGVSPLIPAAAIDNAFLRGEGRRREEFGQPLVQYFAHLDPALSSDNYTMAVVHCEPMDDLRVGPDGKTLQRIVVDHIMFWTPRGKNHPVDITEIDKYVLEIAKKFKLAYVTYDQWNSAGSIMQMRAHNLQSKETKFTADYQRVIFSEMYQLFIEDRIDLYDQNKITLLPDGSEKNLRDADEMREQLEYLQKKWKGGKWKVEALEGQKDDIPDCIAGAAYMALNTKTYQKQAKTRLCYIGGRLS